MFSNLIKLMCAYVNIKPYVLGREMGYKTPSAFQTVITGKDIRLTVLVNICNALGYQIIITNGKTFSININDYLKKQPPERSSKTPPPPERPNE